MRKCLCKGEMYKLAETKGLSFWNCDSCLRLLVVEKHMLRHHWYLPEAELESCKWRQEILERR